MLILVVGILATGIGGAVVLIDYVMMANGQFNGTFINALITANGGPQYGYGVIAAVVSWIAPFFSGIFFLLVNATRKK